MPLLGAVVVCYGWGGGDDQLWGSGRGPIGGTDGVPLQGAIAVCFGWGRVTTNFGGVDVVPLLGAVVVCYGGGEGTTNFGGVDVVRLITQKLFFAIWGLCWSISFFVAQLPLAWIKSIEGSRKTLGFKQ